jgi:hypothetical protein
VILANEETVLQGTIDILTLEDTMDGSECGELEIMKISRIPSPLQIMID